MSSELLIRTFEAEVAEGGDGRTIEARCVPFGVPATVADPPDFENYQEMFLPGAFASQVQAASRVKVWLNFEHEQGLRGIVGHGTTLEERADGLYGNFRVHENGDGDKALSMVHEGALNAMSLEFVPLRSVKRGGIVQRLKAHLDKVSLVRAGAYTAAQVLAVRAAPLTVEEDETPRPFDPELAAMLSRYVTIPDRLQPLLERAFTEAAWNGAESRWPDAAAYCASCAIDRNPAGQAKVKDLCDLPYKEPGSGDVNVNGVRAALARLGQGFPKDATQSERDQARTMLERLLSQFHAPAARSAPLPSGMDATPQGVEYCTVGKTPGYTGGGLCHLHSGDEASMAAAMKKAEADAAKKAAA